MRLVYLFMILFISSCNSNSDEKKPVEKKDSGDNFGMRSFEPVVVDTPKSIGFKPDSSYYIIHIFKNKIAIDHSNKIIQLENLSQFDAYIRKTGGKSLNGKIALEADSSNSYHRIDSVISCLKKCGIDHFNLITDLEK